MSRDTIVILFSLLGSVSLHLLILPIVYVKKNHAAFLTPVKATHLETPKEDKPEIELGIDSYSESTLTWIVYEEYEEKPANVLVLWDLREFGKTNVQRIFEWTEHCGIRYFQNKIGSQIL